MSETKQKKGVLNKVTAVLLSLWLLVLPMAVSAEYTNVDDYGLYYATGSNNRTSKINVGDTVPSSIYDFFACWKVSGLQPDYTYDIFLDVIFESSFNVDNVVNSSTYKLAYSTYSYIPTFVNSTSTYWTQLTNVNGTIEKVSDKHLIFHVFYNYESFNLGLSTIVLSMPIRSSLGGIQGIKVVATGVGAYYDPGGSDYEEILQMINSNVENLPERIKEVLEEHDQDVKDESSTEGNDKIDQAINALKNAIPVSSVKDAITPLMTACNYEGTNSVWTFPSITIPAIPGLFDEMKLSEEQSFDLSTYADEYIPETLLQLVRYLMTAGLILFAIKELMSIISQIFGGSGGGGDGG